METIDVPPPEPDDDPSSDPGPELDPAGAVATYAIAAGTFVVGLAAAGTQWLPLGALGVAGGVVMAARFAMLDHSDLPAPVRAGAATMATIGFLGGILAVISPFL